MLEPKFAAANTNMTGFPNGVLESKSLIDKRFIADGNIFPPAEILAKTHIQERVTDKKLEAYIAKAWARLKAGKK